MSITRRVAMGAMAASAGAAGQQADDEGQRFLLRLVRANEESVRRLADARTSARPGRGNDLAGLVAAYCAPESAFRRSESLIPRMERGAQAFLNALDSYGLLDAGNLSSPPDTAFVVEATGAALAVMRQRPDGALVRVEETLGRFLQRVGAALLTGGVHTPNHRWVVCSALARLHSLFPDARYVERIDDWLGEGLYQDADGLFPERSPNYARVEVNAFVTLARLLNRPALLEPVRRHLAANLYLLQPDGLLETVQSRRQDQDRPVHVANFYLQYRYLAIRDHRADFAAVARLIAERPGEGLVEGTNPVIHFLEEPLLRRPLPAGGAIPADYRRVFADSQLVRVRRGGVAASIFGGDDRPVEIASGLAHNPTFFRFQKGRAVLESVRMGGRFFSLGAFRAEGVRMDGPRMVLHQRLEAPYYQPLPKEYRNARGDYALTPAKDGRFWSKLDFPHRPVSHVQVLDQTVTVVERDGGFDLEIEVGGHDRVPYAVELAFRPGGTLGGALRAAGQGSILTEGMGTYRVDGDGIEFGPGQAEHEMTNLSGHSYQAHGAVLRTAGLCVYITGFTPFRKVITIRGV